jgi:carboxyl-terminal processing protease
MLPDDPATTTEPTTDTTMGTVAAPLSEPPGYVEPIAPVLPVRPRRRRGSAAIWVAGVLVAILGGSALFVSGYALGHQTADEPGTPVSEDQAFEPFWDAYHAIRDRYAGGDVDRETVIEGAIKGMIGALGDPFSTYLTSDEYRQSLQGLGGQFEGIGVDIATQAKDGTQGCTPLGADCHMVVVSPIAGSPADKAGVKAGDLILATDGVSLDGLTVDAASAKVRGPKGTVVTLSIQRGTAAPFDVPVTRDVVQQQEAISRTLANGTVGYVRLTGFSDNGAIEFRDALKAHIDAGRKEIILDLRGNPGGYVTAARSVASQFIGSGPIFFEQDAQGSQLETDALPGGVATDPGIRVLCLVDGGSASASEIVAGALQDTKRAMLVGVQSYGKGTVQEWQQLSDDAGAFKLTVARWLTPDKRWIHKIGLTPDVVVTIPASVPAGQDPILDKALQVLGGSGDVGALAAA